MRNTSNLRRTGKKRSAASNEQPLQGQSGLSSNSSVAFRSWRIAALISTLAALTFISVMPTIANDFWLQAKVGELIVRDGAIPQTLLFPFTAIQSASFNAHEWLSSVAFFGLIDGFGEGFLPFALGGICLILFALTAHLAHRRSEGNLAVALLLGLIAVISENYRNFLRPELLSLVVLTAYWIFLDAWRRRPSIIYFACILVTTIIWANTHGSFILAPIIGAVYAVGTLADGLRSGNQSVALSLAQARRFVGLTLAVLACTLINPFGWNLLKFVLEFSGSHVARAEIIEWFSTFDPRFIGNLWWWVNMACLGIPALLLIWNHRKVSAIDALMFILFALLAFKAIRFLVYAGMVASFVMAPLAPVTWSSQQWQTRLFVICTVLSSAVLGLAMAFGNMIGVYPHRAAGTEAFTHLMVRALRDPDLQGNVLNSYEYGSELVYRAYPRLRPSIDSRVDSYGDAYLEFHKKLLVDDELLSKFVKEYDVRYALLSLRDFQAFMKLPNWTNERWKVRLLDQRAALLEYKKSVH